MAGRRQNVRELLNRFWHSLSALFSSSHSLSHTLRQSICDARTGAFAAGGKVSKVKKCRKTTCARWPADAALAGCSDVYGAARCRRPRLCAVRFSRHYLCLRRHPRKPVLKHSHVFISSPPRLCSETFVLNSLDCRRRSDIKWRMEVMSASQELYSFSRNNDSGQR